MAKTPAKTTQAADLPEFKDGTLYAVQLRNPVEFPPGSGAYFRPDQAVNLDGALARQFAASIASARVAEDETLGPTTA